MRFGVKVDRIRFACDVASVTCVVPSGVGSSDTAQCLIRT